MIWFQVLFLIFSALAIAAILKKKRADLISSRGSIFWVFFWLVADAVVVWPDITTTIANQLGIGRGVDLVLYISVIVVFYILFHLHIKIESMNRDITKIVRKRALDKVDSNEE